MMNPPNSRPHESESKGKATSPENLHITSSEPGRDQKIEPSEATWA